MSADQNKALVRRFFDLVREGNIDAFDDLISPDLIEHEELPGLTRNREGVKQFFRMFGQAFPDLQITLDDVLADEEKVVARSTWRGTHQGEFMGLPATGKAITFSVIDIMRVADGKMVEHWGQADTLGLLQQLGAIPAPGQAG